MPCGGEPAVDLPLPIADGDAVVAVAAGDLHDLAGPADGRDVLHELPGRCQPRRRARPPGPRLRGSCSTRTAVWRARSYSASTAAMTAIGRVAPLARAPGRAARARAARSRAARRGSPDARRCAAAQEWWSARRRPCTRPAPGSCGRWRPAGRRPTRSAWPAACRTSAAPCSPRRRRSPRAPTGPAAGRSPVIVPGDGIQPAKGSSALIRHSMAQPRQVTSACV